MPNARRSICRSLGPTRWTGVSIVTTCVPKFVADLRLGEDPPPLGRGIGGGADSSEGGDSTDSDPEWVARRARPDAGTQRPSRASGATPAGPQEQELQEDPEDTLIASLSAIMDTDVAALDALMEAGSS